MGMATTAAGGGPVVGARSPRTGSTGTGVGSGTPLSWPWLPQNRGGRSRESQGSRRPTATVGVSELFDEASWREVPGFDFTEITYHRAVDVAAVRIAFNRPEVRNAFRP